MRAAAVLFLCACGLPEGFEAVGTGTSFTPVFAVALPAAPAMPELPRMTPCPMGWREIESDPVLCEPWPESGRASCTGDTAHFPGEAGCARVGEACAADGWPTQLPQGRSVVYVRAGAAAGNGSKLSPYGTLAQALAGGGAGNVIALAPGSYEPPGQLPANTVLWGACVTQTTLTLSAGATSPAIVYATAPGIEVHQVRVTGPGVGLAVAGASARLTAVDVIVDGATGVGLLMQMGGRTTARNLVVRSTQPRPDGTLGAGVNVFDGSVLLWTRGVIASNPQTGLFLYNAGAEGSLEQVALWGNGNQGAWVNMTATLRVKASVFEDNARNGVQALSGSTLELTDVVLRRTTVSTAGSGQNVWVDGSQLTATRLRSEDCPALGVGTQGPSTVTIDDLVTQRDHGVGGNSGSQVTVRRSLLRHTVGGAFLSRLAGTQVTAVDATVLDTDAPSSMPYSSAVNVIRGGAFAATRFLAARGRGGSISVTSAGSKLELTDVTVEDTLPGTDGEGGIPIGVSVGATATINRALIRGGQTVGLYALVDATATLSDVDIRGVRPPASQGGLYGNGLEVSDRAIIRGTRVRIFDVGDTAVLAEGAGSSIELTEASIMGTTLACVGNADCANRVPVGVSAQGGAAVKLTRFLVASNVGIGVQVADTAALDLADGEVSFHQIGANVLPAGYDVERLNRNVVYRYQQRNLAAQSVPLPKVAPPPPVPP